MNKKIITGFFILLFVLQFSCDKQDGVTSDRANSTNENNSNSNCVVISSETALLIAKGYMFLDYDLRERKEIIETESELWKDKGETWKITFQRTKNQDAFGGDPIVWILKNNGEILTVRHAK